MPTLLEKNVIEIPPKTPKAEADRIRGMVAKDYVVERILRKFSTSRLSTAIQSPIDRYMLLAAGTGSGKSVTIPPEVYLQAREINKKTVLVIMPKVISIVTTVQDNIIKYYPLKLGEDIGYITRPLSNAPARGLIFATNGVLLQQLKTFTMEHFMAKYSCIIIDEAHERNIETDMIIYMLKKLVSENWDNPECPNIIFMSATMNIPHFVNFLGGDVETIRVNGFTFDINWLFLQFDAGNLIWKTIDTVLQLHDEMEKSDTPDILVFTSGETSINSIISILESKNDADKKFYLIKLTGTTFAAGDKNIIDMQVPLTSLRVGGQIPVRRVIVATNVAETSVTINTLGAVIDMGFHRSVEYTPYGFINILKPISQDMAIQRKGRVGRVAPGVCISMFTEQVFEMLEVSLLPSILTVDPSPAILMMTCLDKFSSRYDLLDKPANLSFQITLEKMIRMNLVKYSDGSIIPTDLGRVVNKFKMMSVENARMILAGFEHNANILALITLVCMLETPPTALDYKPQTEFFMNDGFIDLILLFEKFTEAAETEKNLAEWCEKNGIVYRIMMDVISNRDDLIVDMIQIHGFDPIKNYFCLLDLFREDEKFAWDEVLKIKKCIHDAYSFNVLHEKDSEYFTSYGLKITRPYNLIGNPSKLIYNKIIIDQKNSGDIRIKIGNFSVLAEDTITNAKIPEETWVYKKKSFTKIGKSDKSEIIVLV